MAATPAPTTATSEATIMFYNEPWTAEGARLLLEVDEGWVGFRSDVVWSWHDVTYSVFAAICRERKWSCNSKAACVAMLTALRTGSISMELSNAMRSSDGHSQWSLTEMRELGAHMRRVVDSQSPRACWTAQLEAFVEIMKNKDVKYSIDDRTVEEFAIRAEKYVPDSILLQITTNLMAGNKTPKAMTKAVTKAVTNSRNSRSNAMQKPEQRPRRTTRRQSTVAKKAYDSDDEPLMTLMTRRNSRIRTATNVTSNRATKRRRKRSKESDGDSSYHDPTSEDEDVLFGDDSFQSHEDSAPATQEITSQGELLPMRVASDAQSTAPYRQDSASHVRPSFPQNSAKYSRGEDHESRPTVTSRAQRFPREDPTAKQVASHEDSLAQKRSPLENVPAQQRTSLRQDEPVQKRASRQDTASHAPSTNRNQNDSTPPRQPSHKHQRAGQPAVNDCMTSSGLASNTNIDAPHPFRSLNPYDRPGKPWGEFVVEVLLAERTARNEDELDYVQFVRGLYEI